MQLFTVELLGSAFREFGSVLVQHFGCQIACVYHVPVHAAAVAGGMRS